MDPGVYNFCLRETRATLLGGLLGRSVPFMNDPKRVWASEVKPYQLEAARKFGFTIPDTIVSNDPEEIRRAFGAFNGRMIAKPVRSGYVEQDGAPRAIFTSEIGSDDLKDDAALRAAPAIYQELIPKQCDVRVTVIGRHIFAAEIHSQGDPSARIDWRRTNDAALPHRVFEVPEHLRRALLALMDHLGLAFGAIDLVRTPNDDFVFLEVNPSGQWLWLEEMLDLPITSAICAWLAKPTQGSVEE
jgi:glutathione synthase/RimK-type ligase-like ATP-grasp enzyme